MRVFRPSIAAYAGDLTGYGAKLYGNRWNSEGIAAVYTAEHESLALVEVWAGNGSDLGMRTYKMSTIDIPDDKTLYTSPISLPEDWAKIPASISTKKVGDSFLLDGHYLGLWVPSVIVPHERNLILNPMHRAMATVRVIDQQPFPIDPRFFQK